MSTIFIRKKKCAVCGAENEIQVWGSTFVCGFYDLDFRPPEHERSLLYLKVEECSKCGFVGFNIESNEHADIYKKIADSYSYVECDGINFASRYSENFYKMFIINKHLSMPEISSFIMLRNAAWSCDDSKDYENAKICRIKALKYIEDLLIKNPKDESLILIKIDFLRRSEKYDELINSYNDYEFTIEDYKRTCRFQKHLAKKEDNKIHTFEELAAFINNKY